MPMRLSHVSCGVHDLDAAAEALRRLGLGLWRFPNDSGAHIPLAQWQYVELYAPGHPLLRPGWITWSVAVSDLDGWIHDLALTDQTPFGGDPGRARSHRGAAGSQARR